MIYKQRTTGLRKKEKKKNNKERRKIHRDVTNGLQRGGEVRGWNNRTGGSHLLTRRCRSRRGTASDMARSDRVPGRTTRKERACRRCHYPSVRTST